MMINTNDSLWRLSYLDGLLFALMVATSESYFLYFLTKEGIQGVELGILSTFPIFLASFFLLLAPKFGFVRDLKRGLLTSILVQIIGLFLIWAYSWKEPSFLLALLGLIFYWLGGQFSAPLWLDIFSGQTNQIDFGRLMGKRNSFVILCTLIFFIVFSYLLKTSGSFELIFLIGLIARCLSLGLNVYLLNKYPPKTENLNLDQAPAEAEKVLNHFTFWGAIFRFTVALSSPFFIIYMVKDLNLSAPSYVWLTAMPFLSRAIFQKNWAKASENGRAFYGFQISTLLISSLPILWTLSKNYPYLIFLQLFSGLLWGGVELTQVLMVQNFFHGNSRKVFSKQQAFFGLAATMGGLLGGFLYDKGFQIFDIFNLSTILRFFVAFAFIFQVRKIAIAKLSFSSTTEYLSTLLSLRGSIGLIMRAVPIKTDKNKL
jgi:hypothetical protein